VYDLVHFDVTDAGSHGAACRIEARVERAGEAGQVVGCGNGPIDAFAHALADVLQREVRVRDYHEHALGAGADASAVAYVELTLDGGPSRFGVGIAPSIVAASLRAVVGAVNRVLAAGEEG
jgi:2-isopropylmalate synthase